MVLWVIVFVVIWVQGSCFELVFTLINLDWSSFLAQYIQFMNDVPIFDYSLGVNVQWENLLAIFISPYNFSEFFWAIFPFIFLIYDKLICTLAKA